MMTQASSHRASAQPLRWLPLAAQLAFVAMACAVPFVLSGGSYLLYVATQLAVYIVAAIGLNLLAGYAGQVSLGHAAFLAIGAYATALLSVDHGWPFWGAAFAGVVLSAALGVMMALPSFRLSTWYFAFITLAFALVFEKMIVEWRGLTKGFAGVIGVQPPSLFGFVFEQKALYWLVAGTGLLCFIAVRNLIRSRYGRGLVAVRDNPAAALAAGASPQRLKLLAFVVAASFAGIAGAFFAVQKTVVTPDDFTAEFSIFFLLTVVLGGLGTLWGPVLGALVFFLIPELLAGLASWRMLVYGCALLVLMLFAPRGLVGALSGAYARLSRARPDEPGAHRGERSGPDASDAAPIAHAAGNDSGRNEAAGLPAAATAVVQHPPIQGAALDVRALTKHFGGVAALGGVDLSVAPGTCCAIVGPNGSGKTTLLNVVGGFYERDGGSVRIDGTDTKGMSAQAIAQIGLGRTFQTPRLLGDLAVVDNVLLGAFAREKATLPEIVLRLPRARREAAALRAEALGYLEFVGLADKADVLASEVPHGQQRLIEIARALMGRARLLMLDEPAAGLSLAELDKLDQLILRIRTLGATVVVVEHHLDLVASIASHVMVLDRGQVLAAGAPNVVFADPAVQRAYMGERALQGAEP